MSKNGNVKFVAVGILIKENVGDVVMTNKEIYKEIYRRRIRCSNCDVEVFINIPVGTLIKTFLRDLKCDNCGCKCMVDAWQ